MTIRDHGGRLSDAVTRFGGDARDWIDLSTGINPTPYITPQATAHSMTALPDPALVAEVEALAATFWNVPSEAEVVAVNGASAAIAALPLVLEGRSFSTPDPTYNEFAASFLAQDWQRSDTPDVAVIVNPNNPDGQVWADDVLPNTRQRVIDESFCDTMPEISLITLAARPGHMVLKSFGKFWGLAGLRLGFAICLPPLAKRFRALMGPWPVSGPALEAGRAALSDEAWAKQMRKHLVERAAQLDACVTREGLTILGGTPLFRLIDTPDAAHLQEVLARHRIWSRIFPYSPHWVRLGLPGDEASFARLRAALQDM